MLFTKLQASYITYDRSGGRFGDNLICYCHAKWLSYKYNLTLLYQSFIYSEELILSDLEQKFNSTNLYGYRRINIDGEKNIITIPFEDKILFNIPFFSESKAEYNWWNGRFKKLVDYTNIDWNNKEFKELLNKFIKPKKNLSLFYPPEDKLSVAIHIRTGGTLETLESWSWWGDYTLKMPPFSYYIDQIKKIIDIIGNKKIYFHIFTDDSNPKNITNLFKVQIPNENIEFGYREENSWDKNVLEDFFSLLNFDCLIFTQSHYSIMASKLKDYKITIMPLHYIKLNNGEKIIDEVEIINNYKS